jgi:hypothetical protein
MTPPALLYFSPLLLALELVQLIAAERLLGLKAIQRKEDPRRTALPPRLAACWSIGILLNGVWMLAMLASGFGTGRVSCMIATSLLGYTLRRASPLRWTLVILTFEGAIRMGMHVSLLMLAWRLR